MTPNPRDRSIFFDAHDEMFADEDTLRLPPPRWWEWALVGTVNVALWGLIIGAAFEIARWLL